MVFQVTYANMRKSWKGISVPCASGRRCTKVTAVHMLLKTTTRVEDSTHMVVILI